MNFILSKISSLRGWYRVLFFLNVAWILLSSVIYHLGLGTSFSNNSIFNEYLDTETFQIVKEGGGHFDSRPSWILPWNYSCSYLYLPEPYIEKPLMVQGRNIGGVRMDYPVSFTLEFSPIGLVTLILFPIISTLSIWLIISWLTNGFKDQA